MQKITITTDSYGDGFDWYFDNDYLDIVIVTNDRGRLYVPIGEDREWYRNALGAIQIINDFENYEVGEEDNYDVKPGDVVIDGTIYAIESYAIDCGIPVDVAESIAREVLNGRYFDEDNIEDVVDVLNLINGEGSYTSTGIRGYYYADVIYPTSLNLSRKAIHDIESFFFGGYYDIHVEDTDGEHYWSYMPSYPAKLEDLEEWTDVKVTPDTIIIDETGSGLGQNEDMEDRWDESESRLDRTTYDPRRWGNEYDLDTISKINESRRLRRSKRVMSSSRLHPSRRRTSVKASRSVRRGRR